MSQFPLFDRDRIKFRSVRERHSKLDIVNIVIRPNPNISIPLDIGFGLYDIAEQIVEARRLDRPVILCMGAHAVKNGCCLLINDMVQRGWITHIATNGAAAIHDWEFAAFGKSTECVRTNVALGEFGIWEETGRFFGATASLALQSERGWGEAIGHCMSQNIGFGRSYKYPQYSVMLNAYKCGIPYTIHPGVGQDIVHCHPFMTDNIGCTMTDFLIFAENVRKLEGGVFLSIGSSVMSPMIFEKALSMARNVEHQSGRIIKSFWMVVNDLQEASWDWAQGEPPMDHADYYLRFYKSFHRMGGALRYFSCDNRKFLHLLWKLLALANSSKKNEK